jgi:exo-beta-1,3-glucanase (GH17 family)
MKSIKSGFHVVDFAVDLNGRLGVQDFRITTIGYRRTEAFGGTRQPHKVIMLTRMMKMALAYGLILAAVSAFWYAIGHPRLVKEPALAIDHKLQSVSYAPFEKNQSPLDLGLKGLTISDQRIDTDLAILSRRFECIRTYSVAGLEAVPAFAEKYGLKVLLGAWISGDPVLSQKEVTKVIELARRHPACVRAIVVGNEALLRREVTGPQLVEYIRQVKSALPGIPVTYADVWEFWLKHPDVAPATDFVMIHILPYWEDDPVSIDQSMAHVRKIRKELARKIPDKEIVIGETGWPSEGRMREGALPSPVNQARFMRGFVALAEKEHWQYNLIEAFDQPWKRAKEGAVGGYWGLYTTDRIDKNVFSGPVSNYPHWPAWFCLSAGIVLLTLFISGRNSGMSGIQWLKFSGVTAAGAVLIAMQCHQFSIISRNGWETLWAVMVLGQAAIVYFLALSAIAFDAMPEHLSLKASMDLLRGRFRPEAGDACLRAPDGGRFFPSFVLRHLTSVISINRLAVFALALIAVTGLFFDARYRSFNNCGFILPALGYVWFSRKAARPALPGGLEKLIYLTLAIAGMGVFIKETPLNWQADVWVGICLLLAYPLWREGRDVTLRPLLASGVLLAAAYAIFAVLRYVILDSNMVMSLCAENAAGIFCLIRNILGKLMYHQVFGLASLGLAGLAVWRNNAWLCLLAMIASLGSFAFYNVSMGAIAFVLAGLTLAHNRLAPDIM